MNIQTKKNTAMAVFGAFFYWLLFSTIYPHVSLLTLILIGAVVNALSAMLIEVIFSGK